MAADFASTPACVACHNALPNSPKQDYELGDMMGSLVVTVPLTEEFSSAKTVSLYRPGEYWSHSSPVRSARIAMAAHRLRISMDRSRALSSARLRFAREEILRAAPTSANVAQRVDDLIKDAEGVTSAIGKAAITELVEERVLHRVGTGRRNDAYRYWTPELINTASSSGEGGIQGQNQDLGTGFARPTTAR